ncbi:MAG: competence/damage-inducible protein A [Blastocatellia bacterium]|nr:competence/damage-inducible protein A [Blastocatellia bacterium]MCS7157894.1 competence/damage-inducible protein A [Blastocatellia bacterium]MCX7753369.1 competence/damage-inducible protein A [Blastocatellia bacterium]MDW8168028.1 competence/damage-inducible protein A [Acidobacteriota bacterium]MDW8255768.1 competence/damage-inducible protein A [Acidobacteriota bacterium]
MRSERSRQAEIIAVGSELLTPFHVDTNSLWLTERLNALGIEVVVKTIVGDDEALLERLVREALARSEILILTGGLGPTEDDVTRKALARALGRGLVLDEQVLERIRMRFASRGLVMPAINERQALVLEGAIVLENRYGTAPGMFLEHQGHVLVALPGPPSEMRVMFESEVVPLLEPLAGGLKLRYRTLRIAGMSESAVDQAIAPIYTQYTNPRTTILATTSGIEIHLTAVGPTEEEIETRLNELSDRIEQALGARVFTTRGESLEEVIGRLCVIKRYTIAVAESVTGGLVAKRLTDVPGSSRYFRGGITAYSDEAKTTLLGVPADLLAAHGAVSAVVAEAMAQQVKAQFATTIGLAVTGLAGPEGGTSEKPVGLVFIALADDVHVESHRHWFSGDRARIRELAAQAALALLYERLL